MPLKVTHFVQVQKEGVMTDLIEFEPVPREVARQALAQIPGAGTPAPAAAVASAGAEPLPSRPRRRSTAEEDAVLGIKAQQWLLSLPSDVRPQALSQQFPRIANELAALWKQPTRCERHLKSLLVTDRPSRAGFAPEIAVELCSLLDYYVQVLYPASTDPWGPGF